MNTSAEAHFCQQLASNQPPVREKALKKLGKWFEKISVSPDALSEDSLLKLWKGIFFYFWHCDKMLVQEDRADVIVQFINEFKSINLSLLYVDTFFTTIAKEWHGIDRFRMEKFLMLVRRMLHESYRFLQKHKWNLVLVRSFLGILRKTVLSPSSESAPFGLKIHISDIYMEELAKVAADEITPKLLRRFLLPYLDVLCKCDDPSILSAVKKDVFLYLINQDVDEVQFHQFPVIKFKPKAVQKLLLSCSSDVPRKNMKIIHSIVKEYEDYQRNFCLAEKIFQSNCSNQKLRKRAIIKATEKLIEEEEKEKRRKLEYKKTKKLIKQD